jgi:outer membrane immunogenic protein
MKKIVITAALAALASSSAFAADLPSKKSSAVAPIMAVANWNGFYVGANAGYGWGTEKDPYVTPVIGTFNTTGGLFGLQAGYNYQIGNYVVGAETDYSWANLNDTKGIGGAAVINGRAISAAASIKTSQTSLGTVRLRAGYAFDNFLVYATGGYAYGANKVDISASVSLGGVTWGGAAGNNQTHNGWVIGAGTEYAITKNISAKIEYLYADLGSSTYWGGTVLSDSVSVKDNILRAGVNYKF